MKKNNVLIFLLIFFLIFLSFGVTYAFLQTNDNNNQMTGEGGCFVVDYVGEEGQYISPSNNLETSSDYTSGGSSTVTLSKNVDCQIYTQASIYLNTNEDGTSSQLLGEGALKYTVVNGSDSVIASGTINATGVTTLAVVNLTSTATTYTIYIWVDSDITYNSDIIYDELTYSGYIYADAIQSSTYTD